MFIDQKEWHIIVLYHTIIKCLLLGAYYSLILKKNGKLILFGDIFEDHEKQQIFDHPLLSFESSSKVKQIVCGEDHTIILKESGEVIGFGYNHSGQLGGKPTRDVVYPLLLLTSNDAKTISCGVDTSIIYLNNGELLGFGSNFQKDQKWEEIVKPILLIKDDNINFLDNALVERNWTSNKHNEFSESFKQRVLLFVLHLKRNQLKIGLKIPKFVLFEIIKKTI